MVLKYLLDNKFEDLLLSLLVLVVSVVIKRCKGGRIEERRNRVERRVGLE